MLRHLPCLAMVAALAMMVAACAPGPSPSPTVPSPPQGAKPQATAAPTRPSEQPATKALPADYFSRKTITAVVDFSAGGPTDVFARLIARHLGKHLAGSPNIVVQNMPGGGGNIARNHLYNTASKDGLSIGVFSGLFSQQIFGAPGVQYDAAKFNWLGGVPEASVAYVRGDIGVRKPEDLGRTSQEIVMGGFTPDNSKDLSQRVFLNMAGVKYKYVTGYPGNADARNALLRGEINFFSESLTGWVTGMKEYVQNGTVVAVGQTGILKQGQAVRDPNVSDIPTFQEVAVAIRGEAVRNSVEYRANMALLKIQTAMLRAIVLPPGVHQEAVEALRKAVVDTFADPEFQAEAERLNGFRLELIPGNESQQLAQEIIGSGDREALDYLQRLSKEG